MRIERIEAVLRLIPACAGKTMNPPTTAERTTAHPRVCGENNATKRSETALQGSSPRVRGKPGKLMTQDWNQGLIPACAGKTWTWLM